MVIIGINLGYLLCRLHVHLWQVLWLSAIDTLLAELHDASLEEPDHVRHPRAVALLRHLASSVHAEGAGLAASAMRRGASGLLDILGQEVVDGLL